MKDRWQYNVMNIKIENMDEVSAYLIKNEKGNFKESSAFDISPGMTRSFTRLDSNEEFWVIYEPNRNRNGKIRISAKVDHYTTEEKEKNYILALEEADRKEREEQNAEQSIEDA